MDYDKDIFEVESGQRKDEGVNIESFMSPDDQNRLDLLRMHAQSISADKEPVSGSVHVLVAEAVESVRRLFLSRKERNQKDIEELLTKLREVIGGADCSDGRLFPKLRLVINASEEVQKVLDETDVRIPAELFSYMHSILTESIWRQKPSWFRPAREKLSGLSVLIGQYKDAGMLSAKDHRLMAIALAEGFYRVANIFLEWLYVDEDF